MTKVYCARSLYRCFKYFKYGRTARWTVHGLGFSLLLLWLALPVHAWRETFPGNSCSTNWTNFEGDQTWIFQNVAPVTGATSETLVACVGENSLSIVESEPYAIYDATSSLGLDFGPGAISFVGHVLEPFVNVVVRARINPDRGASAPYPPVSRQGVIARWNLKNDFYGFHVDFTHGEIGIIRQSSDGSGVIFPESILAIPGFDNSASYVLEFEIVAASLQGTLFDSTGVDVLARTPRILDRQPHGPGVAGILIEAPHPSEFPLTADSTFFLPLTGSYSEYSANESNGVFIDSFESGDRDAWQTVGVRNRVPASHGPNPW